MQNLFNPDFTDFLELLNNHKVKYLLVGGYAVIIHGYIRSTGDIDLWVEKSQDNYLKIQKVYKDFGAPIFSENDFLKSDYNVWSIGQEPSKIEILTHVDGLNFKEGLNNCKWFTIESFSQKKINLPYIAFKDLIKNKTASGRYKDLADIEQLNKLNKNSK